MKIHLAKSDYGLIPATDDDAKKMLRLNLKPRQVVEVTIRKVRNYRFHRKFFALLNLGFENQDWTDDFEHYRYVMTMRAGYYEKIPTDRGEAIVPRSVSFEKMDAEEFEQLYKVMVLKVAESIGTTEQEVMEQLIEFI